MDKPVVVAAAPLSTWLREGLEQRYRLVAADAAEAGAAQVLVTTGTHGADAALIDALPALRLIAVHGVGYDQVDLAHTRARDIAVTNTPDVLTDDVADLALGLVLAAGRRLAANDALVRAGGWGSATIPLARRVSGRRFGIVGLGRIGEAIARRVAPLASEIAYHNRHRRSDCAYCYFPSVEALAAHCDVLIVAASGGADSRHLVDAAVLAALGPDGILVNIGRGTAVDERALVAALQDGRIGAAGLDVFAQEPDVPAALLALDQVVLSPHQGSATADTRRAMAALTCDNVHAFFDGAPLVTPV